MSRVVLSFAALAVSVAAAAEPAAEVSASADAGDLSTLVESSADAGTPPAGGLSVVPFGMPAYQPETSFLLGAFAMLVYEPPPGSGRRTSQLLLAGVATLRKQFSLLLQPDWYLFDDRLRVGATLSVARFPDQFFGMGANTRVEDRQNYTPVLWEGEVNPTWRIADNFYLGPNFRIQQVQMVELPESGELASGGLVGSKGGRTIQLGLSAAYDSRDTPLFPTQGSWVRANFRSAAAVLGSNFVFDVLKIDARKYWTLPWAQHILAVQALVELRRGEPPFYDTGKMGGDAARGHFEGRFRDRQLFSIQAEYRAHLFWRVSGVAFGSVSTVARDLDSLSVAGIKPAGGVGLRLAPLKDVPINVRFDVAYGSDLSFYLNVGEAF